jgi:hypothetical protein
MGQSQGSTKGGTAEPLIKYTIDNRSFPRVSKVTNPPSCNELHILLTILSEL